MSSLFRPFVVFDAGIGSYLIVEMIRRHYPRQDVLYIADRASFPYGSKPPEKVRECVQRVVDAALTVEPSVIVIASNAPSVMVFQDMKVPSGVCLRGVFPPIRAAIELSKSRHVTVLGVRSLIESVPFKEFIVRERAAANVVGDIGGINASSMVELVESGKFLSDAVATQEAVERFIASARRSRPSADVYTLSSTHLPWLRPFFERAAPDIIFLDPAEEVVNTLAPLATIGASAMRVWVTESSEHPAAQFVDIVHRLQLEIAFSVCCIP